ncbi:CU044_5270 family protein [Paenarthrobacter sp. NPDC018779]|uniref:CU044_5270 family protein n=1 Tax=Paenarthrobacter sp. NPDC018779 TaxID=3364375 RepID=UPI0037CB9F49
MKLSEAVYPKDTRDAVRTMLVEQVRRTGHPERSWQRRNDPGENVPTSAQTQRSSSKVSATRRIILIAAAASVAAGVLTTADVLNTTGSTAPAAQAAELLNRAADSAIAVTDPLVGPKQYLRLDINSLTVMGTESLAWKARSESQLFVPYDRQDEWILDIGPVQPTEFIGSTTKQMVDEYYSSRGLQNPEPARQLRGLGGQFMTGGNGVSFGNLTPAEESSIPREPAALVDWIRAKIKGTDSSVWSFIADQLISGTVPAEWRAALYRAAALVPGATVTAQQTTLDGRTGVAVGWTEDGLRTDIILDPETGLFIGLLAVNVTGNALIPAGTVTGWTSVKTSVVDSAP